MMAPILFALLSRFPGLERELRLLPMVLHPGRVAVDIGASLGVYAFPMAALVGATGAVWAFEPRPDAARRLGWIARILGLSHLQVHAAALGAVAGRQRLVIPQRSRPVPGRSFLHPGTDALALDDQLRPGTVVDVPVSTLDSARREGGRRIDFVKCDVEGAEHDVFLGGATVLREDRPYVLCEVESRHTRRYGGTTEQVMAMFREQGYCVVELKWAPPAPRNILFAPVERGWPPQ